MKLLSIDVALKSLAISRIEYPDSKLNLEIEDNYSKLKVLNNITIDLAPNIPSKSIPTLERVRLITNFIKENILKWATEKDTTILIEEQIKTTDAYTCYISILTLFIASGISTKSIKIRGGSIKNQQKIGGITREMAYTKTIDKYRANKEHCRMMFLYIKDKLGGITIEYNKKMETDLADTYIQSISYLKEYYL